MGLPVVTKGGGDLGYLKRVKCRTDARDFADWDIWQKERTCPREATYPLQCKKPKRKTERQTRRTQRNRLKRRCGPQGGWSTRV